jgi:hypothetical protein
MKDLLAKAQEQLRLAQEKEEQTGEAINSMERNYWEGYIDALNDLADKVGWGNQ